MAINLVFTLTGHDKIGVVDQVIDIIVGLGGNVEISRMARLGGEFAMLMMVSMPTLDQSKLDNELQSLRDEGFRISLMQTEDEHAKKYSGWLPYEIEVLGADHDGIIHDIAHHLADQGINIETMDTSTSPAPMSGTPLFSMKAMVIIPPQLPFQEWSDALDEIGDNLNVTIKIKMVT